ncbi:MAG TPA: DUF1697 domain-containing protein [Gaiellaceae bacterium]|nr:DUF1697 domain-containing protein [Gaiellaceae bacterium]
MRRQPWCVLLRAVNLGARNRVPMAELRRLLAEAGHEDVRTYIASGNVLLRAPGPRDRVARELEELIAAAFSVDTTAIVRTPRELAAVAAARPFGRDTSSVHVAFLATQPARDAVRRLSEADHGPDRVQLAGSDVFLHYPRGVQGARLGGARLEKLLGVAATVRNFRTVTALAELA